MSDRPTTTNPSRKRTGDKPAAAPPMPARIGRYEIECELGRGGMGIVYRARDTRLDRLVALKALPRHVVSDPEARERFEREARLLAALEHPHVAPIYGIEDDATASYLVLQHVQGSTLAQVLKGGPLPPAEALEIAIQIASGIAAAHRRGIVHCDLKPANVMIMDDRTAKIVDFGIATRWSGAEGVPGAHPGYGTPAYMSPEQIRGEGVDPRTDAWSFGCTLLECVTGAPAFDGDSPEILLGRILRGSPDWSALPPLPRAARDVIERCLVRDRDGREGNLDAVRRDLTAALHALKEPAAPPPSGLPRALSSFVGRDRELAEIGERLSSSRLLTLTGAAGCGKSRLALEAARRAGPANPDGTWLAALAPLADPSHVVPCVAAAMGLPREPGPTDATLVAALEDRAALLILDNCEHLLPESARLSELLLARCPRLTLLATSREALGLPGEIAWHVPSMSRPAADAPKAELASGDAMGLFLARAREARPGYEPDEPALRAIAAILQRLDGIPLAIELAAARMKILSPEQILERLADRFRLLTGGSRTALERHQTLRAALEWSYSLLSEDDRRCLRELSVFAGGFRLEEAVTVCTGDEFEVLDRVCSLVLKSLVQIETDARKSPRYRLLESVRQHAMGKLEEAEESGPARDRHRDAYRALVDAAVRQAATSGGTAAARLLPEQDNLRAALEWSLSDPGGGEAALEIAASLDDHWDVSGQWREGLSWLDRALHAAGESAPAALRARAFRGRARMHWWLSNLPEAEADAVTARELGLRSGAVAEAVRARMMEGLCLHARGDLRAAAANYEESVAAARACGDDGTLREALLNLAVTSRDSGNPARSEQLAKEALGLAEAAHASRQVARALRLVGSVARDRGELDEAAALIRRALRLHEECHERRDAATARRELAFVQHGRGDVESARALLAQGAEECRGWGDRHGMAMALGNLGLIELENGLQREGEAKLVQAVALSREAGRESLVAGFLLELAWSRRDAMPAADCVSLMSCAATARERLGRRLSGPELVEQESRWEELRGRLGSPAFEEAWETGARRSVLEAAASVLPSPDGRPSP